jgi:hypothetical protein
MTMTVMTMAMAMTNQQVLRNRPARVRHLRP